MVREQAKGWIRLGKALIRDPRIPRPVRWLLALGLLPIPGPLDEAVALLGVGLVALLWRPVLRQIRAEQNVAPHLRHGVNPPLGFGT